MSARRGPKRPECLLESLPIIAVMGKDSLAQIVPAETAIGRPTATARRLVEASVSANTSRAYAGALGQLDARLAGQKLDDAALAADLAELHDAGRAASSAATAVAAARFRARLAGQADPVRRADRPSPRRVPQNGRRPRPRPGPPVQRRGPGGRARHVRPAAASSPTRWRPRAAGWTP